MSEFKPLHNPETNADTDSQHQAERLAVAERSDEQLETDRQTALETSRQQIELEARTSESVVVGEKVPEPSQQFVINKQLKDDAYQRILTRTRKQMSASDRIFSTIVHQPVVNRLSQISESTLARPTGILGGGITALIGSSLILYLAKHYGFRYNFLIFSILFVAGYGLGLVVELVMVLAKKALAKR